MSGGLAQLVRPSAFDAYPPVLDGLAQDGPYRAVVDRIHDGDTFDAIVDLGFGVYVYIPVRVRGCNAPELPTPEGAAARQFVIGLMPESTPVLLSIERDFVQSFTRYVCSVTLPDRRDLAEVLIESGHAVPMARR